MLRIVSEFYLTKIYIDDKRVSQESPLRLLEIPFIQESLEHLEVRSCYINNCQDLLYSCAEWIWLKEIKIICYYYQNEDNIKEYQKEIKEAEENVRYCCEYIKSISIEYLCETNSE